MSSVNKLAEAHWEYIKDLLMNHGLTSDQSDKIGFHYKTAFIHGYKHGQEELVKLYKNTYQGYLSKEEPVMGDIKYEL